MTLFVSYWINEEKRIDNCSFYVDEEITMDKIKDIEKSLYTMHMSECHVINWKVIN